MNRYNIYTKNISGGGAHCFAAAAKFFLYVLMVLLLAPCSLDAQTLNLSQFGIEEGLPQSSVYTMLQDKQGNIWVGTMNGVSKYNGLNFENFNKKDGLAENRVTSACLDNNGDIWFGHWSGGITKYDAVAKKFSEVLPTEISLSKTITSIVADKSGTMWFATEGQGIMKMEKGVFSKLTVKDGLLSDAVSSLMVYKDGTLWIGTSNGIMLLKSKLQKLDAILPSVSITDLFCDVKGNIWVGTSDYGLIRINASDKALKVYNTTHGLASNNVNTIYQADNGNIFIGTYDGGVSKYLPALEANNYKGAIFQTISTQHGLSNNRVLSIIQDREKNIWIGTFFNLNQYFDEQFEIYGDNEGLPNSLVWSVIEGDNNDYWIGTEGGLFQFIPNASATPDNAKGEETKGGVGKSKGTFRFIRHTGKEGEVLNTSALYKDVKGNIWFTDFGQGVSRLNPATGDIKLYSTETGLPVNEIYSINGDKDGNVWIGTNKGGLLKFDIATEKFVQYTTDEGMGSNQIYTIYHDSKDRMWFGGLSGSLTMYDPNNLPKQGGLFRTFNEKNGYASKFTICITEDGQGNLWFGTYDQGVYKYDPLALLERNGVLFKNYSIKQGLSSNTPFLLVCDTKSNLWIGSGLGIDKFDLRNETVKHYEKEDGFLGVEINPNAACKDKDGNLWFGSIIGLVKYNSRLERNNLVEPVTSIRNPRIYFQAVEIPEDHVFPWTQNHFTFDFVGTSLTNPKRVKYRYMLEGLDNDWSPVVKENSVTYPNLEPGEYTFKVRSCNNDGIWNSLPITYHFVIKPPFWQTTLFYILLGIVVISGIIFFIKLRERVLRKENIILERKVAERTEVISKQSEEIEKKNVSITDNIEYAQNIQKAILPSEEEISRLLRGHFILYKPKDIVSGDFYWVHEEKDRVLIAVADCTGHGVSGAFVSVMGHNLLNNAINDHHMATPAEILYILNDKILNTLRQNTKNTSAKYGMDIALISISKHVSKGPANPPKEEGTETALIEGYELQYAGAHNPLLIYRNNECIQLKANPRSIGSYKKTGEQGFTNHTFHVQKDDMLYMFSDGYVDQLGGPENKKIFAQPFRDILQFISGFEMTEQRRILDEKLENWKGGQSQTDDVLVVGIRV
jgi:ligand-binding sensor domain-containing protein/serine phosphatase RsbU (regulator of sigma subunit)